MLYNPSIVVDVPALLSIHSLHQSPFASLSPSYTPTPHAVSVIPISLPAASHIMLCHDRAAKNLMGKKPQEKNEREHHICLNDLLHPRTPHWLQTCAAAATIGLLHCCMCTHTRTHAHTHTCRTHTPNLFLEAWPDIGPYWGELLSPVWVLTAALCQWKKPHSDLFIELRSQNMFWKDSFIGCSFELCKITIKTEVEWIWSICEWECCTYFCRLTWKLASQTRKNKFMILNIMIHFWEYLVISQL